MSITIFNDSSKQTSPWRPADFSDGSETIEEFLNVEPMSQINHSIRPSVISFVIPVKNECATLRELQDRIIANTPTPCSVEIIFIDDGSTDSSWQVIRELVESNQAKVRGIRFRRNSGKAAALTAGFRAATGGIVFTLDADLQDDPAEIPAMIAKLAEGYDIVSGWKKIRHDPWHKVLPSRVFNRMVSKVCAVPLHDHNCGFKCYRAEVTQQLTLHGEMHRMIPSLAAIKGFRTAEVAVNHHPRRHGVSKYGFERYVRGFFDMLTVGFIRKFGERPSHLIGQMAMAHLTFGLFLMAAGLLTGIDSRVGETIAIIAAIVLVMTVPLLVMGLLGELVIRGGMPASWRLPVAEDTSFPQSGNRSPANSGPQRIPLTYA